MTSHIYAIMKPTNKIFDGNPKYKPNKKVKEWHDSKSIKKKT